MPAAFHNADQYANNRVEYHHGRLKARLRPMRGLKREHTARVIMRGHSLMQNIRRGHYELGIDARTHIAASSTRLRNSRTQSDGETGRQLGPARHVPSQRISAVSAVAGRETLELNSRCTWW